MKQPMEFPPSPAQLCFPQSDGVAGNNVVGVAGGVSSIIGGLAADEELVTATPRIRSQLLPIGTNTADNLGAVL